MIKHKIIIRKRSLYPVTTQTTTPIYESTDIDVTFAETLNVLFEGMSKGNQIDKKAAEALLYSIRYKSSQEFYLECLRVYKEALILHEAAFGDTIVKKMTKNLSEVLEEGKRLLNTITQHIIIPDSDPQCS